MARRTGPAQARGPGEQGRTDWGKETDGHGEQGAEGTGATDDTLDGAASHLSGSRVAGRGGGVLGAWGRRLERRAINRGRPKDRDQRPGESHGTTKRLAVRTTKEPLRDMRGTYRGPGHGEPLHGRDHGALSTPETHAWPQECCPGVSGQEGSCPVTPQQWEVALALGPTRGGPAEWHLAAEL